MNKRIIIIITGVIVLFSLLSYIGFNIFIGYQVNNIIKKAIINQEDYKQITPRCCDIIKNTINNELEGLEDGYDISVTDSSTNVNLIGKNVEISVYYKIKTTNRKYDNYSEAAYFLCDYTFEHGTIMINNVKVSDGEGNYY